MSERNEGTQYLFIELGESLAPRMRWFFTETIPDKIMTNTILNTSQYEMSGRVLMLDASFLFLTNQSSSRHSNLDFALSNMPLEQGFPVCTDGWCRAEFQKTVKMSTYLTAFAIIYH